MDLHKAKQHLVGMTDNLKDLNNMLWEQGLLMMDHILKVQISSLSPILSCFGLNDESH